MMPEDRMPLEERLKRKNAFDAGLVMGVEKFHRKTGRDLHLKSGLQESLARLIDPDTGLLKKDLARDRDCPVCGGRFENPLFVKDGFTHGRCPECHLIYVNPVLKDTAVLEHYQQESSWVKVMDSGPQVEFDRLKYAYGLDLAHPYLRGNRCLDVGAGSGLFLKTARQYGLEAEGIELNSKNVLQLRQAGFEIIDLPLEKAGLEKGAYDLVTLWEVLEHIVHPDSMLEEIRRLLHPQGILLILVPNADSLATRILHERSGTFGGHSHVNHFNISNLTRLLDRRDFSILEAETVITELGVINNFLNFEDPYLGQASGGLDILTPQLIHEKLLGSKLLVFARLTSNKEQK